MLNLCFSGSTAAALKYVFRNRRERENLACLPLGLSQGDISRPMSVEARKHVYETVGCDYPYFVDHCIEEFQELSEGESRVRIWYSSGEANEFCGLLHAVSLLREKELSAIDCSREMEIDNGRVQYRHSGELDERALELCLEYDLLLSEDDKERYSCIWDRLQADNTPLRAVKKGEISSVAADYYDDSIKKHLRGEETSVARIIGELLMEDLLCSDAWIAERLRYFIQTGLLRLVREKEDFYRSTVKLEE